MGKSCQIEFWQAQSVDNPALLFYPSKCDITRPPNFQKFLQTAEECCNRNICRTCYKLVSLVKSNFDRYNRWTILLLYVCQSSDSIFDVRFPTCQFYPSKCDVTRPPSFRKFLQTAEECCNRNICGTFWKLGSLIKSNFDGYNQQTILPLYMCKISDSWFDLRFPTCLYYPSKCDIIRPTNFQQFLQTSEEFCNKSFQSVSLFRKQERIINRSTID